MSYRKTRTTGEAMGLLEGKHSTLIAIARDIAIELIRRDGSTHSRAVRKAMFERGIIAGNEGREHWLGAVFCRSMFEWTGGFITYADRERNVHERLVKTWRLRSPSTSNGDEHKGRSRSSDVRPSSGSGAPAAPKKAEPLPCMQLDLLGAAR